MDIEAAKTFAAGVEGMFEDDAHWSIYDVPGARAFLASIGYVPKPESRCVDGLVMRAVEDLLPGDKIDLSSSAQFNNAVDDPEGYSYEYAVVEAVVCETPDSVTVYNGQMNFCFKRGEMIGCDEDQSDEDRAENLAEYREGWVAGDYAGPRGVEPYATGWEEAH